MMTLGGYKEQRPANKKTSPKITVSTECLDRIKVKKSNHSPTKKKKLLGGLEQKVHLKQRGLGNRTTHTAELRTFKAKDNIPFK